MLVTIHQPEHLPWLGFFDKMSQADVFVLLDTTQFAKNDFQNRNRIKTPKGPAWLTVPVFTKGRSSQKIINTEICNDRNWRSRCWSLIDQNYREAPHYAEHRPFFKDLYDREWQGLIDINVAIILYLAEQLGLETEFVTASELEVYDQGATSVNLAICRTLGADAYLSGAHGREYLDEIQFTEQGIEVLYQEFQHPVYPQLWGDFLSHMSAVDLLFNCGRTGFETMKSVTSAQLKAEESLAAA